MEITPSLLIDGRWSSPSRVREVRAPATGAVLARIGMAGREEAEAAVEAAARALPAWRRTTGMERSAILARAAALIGERAEAIGRALSEETGKLLREAVGEVRFGADYFAWFAGEARRLEGLRGVSGRNGGPQLVLRRPVGVVATLTPWNFPVSIQARKLAPALAAGCTVVARPSEQAPLSVIALMACLQEAGLPPGVANLLIGPAGPITETLLADQRVRLISFTGSTPVGQMLYERSAAAMRRVALELGGCAPFVVCDDADLERAVDQAMIAKFRNYGQSCIGANTFYVAEPLYERFVEAFAARMAALRPGDPLDDASSYGPLINARRRDELVALVERAQGAGLEPLARGPACPPGLDPACYLAPALLGAPRLDGVDAAFLAQELFGPVAVVVGFDDLEGLLAQLNAQPLGLAGYVFAGDQARALRIGARLEVGIVGVNDGLPSAANVPMGGVKQSGLGREGGHEGLEEFLELQYLALAAPLA
ncbi:MAG TPA: aldehyde dehydrogenase family protein [Chloroflexaceae bacterium]|nr:aldehyde dehydrogenase family protein [Chloroflexaceae bacterium]